METLGAYLLLVCFSRVDCVRVSVQATPYDYDKLEQLQAVSNVDEPYQVRVEYYERNKCLRYVQYDTTDNQWGAYDTKPQESTCPVHYAPDYSVTYPH